MMCYYFTVSQKDLSKQKLDTYLSNVAIFITIVCAIQNRNKREIVKEKESRKFTLTFVLIASCQ